MSVTEVEFAQKVRDRIATGWCRHVSAQDRQQNSVAVWDPWATSFCLGGAASRVRMDLGASYTVRSQFAAGFCNWLGISSMSTWNDRQISKKYVLDTLDAYIRHLKGLQ